MQCYLFAFLMFEIMCAIHTNYVPACARIIMMFIFNYSNLVDPLLKDLRAFVTNFAGIKAGDRVLDVCCGTGEQVLDYGRRGIIATGIDNDPDMLNVALKNRKRHDLLTTSFQLADAKELPFPNGYFNYASISFGLHDKTRLIRKSVVSEIKRVVKRNGIIILVDFNAPLPQNAFGLAARMIEFFAGGEHYRSFKDYLASGGLDGILKEHDLVELNRTQLKSGLVGVIKETNN